VFDMHDNSKWKKKVLGWGNSFEDLFSQQLLTTPIVRTRIRGREGVHSNWMLNWKSNPVDTNREEGGNG